MHPWKLIIRGKTERGEFTVCFMCLESVPYSKEAKDEFQKHMTTVHFSDCPIEHLFSMCQEIEERQGREGFGFDDIIKEEKERREPENKRKVLEIRDTVSGIKCFLCKEKWSTISKHEFKKHLERYHRVIFGSNEIMKKGNEIEYSDEETYI